nr:reverse transcriptase domain-containing protein [Tanacetum cinerariifolium]
MSKITSSSYNLSVIFLLNTSIIARAVTKNGHPKIIGTLESSGISKITKSIGRTNLSTFMSTFSTIPLGYWNDLSASSKLILVAFGSPNPSFSYIVYGIKLILALRVASRNVNPVTARACYECGSTDHIKSACPRLNRAQRPGGNRPNQALANNKGQGRGNHGNQERGRAFMLGAEGDRQDLNIMTGMFTLNDHYATTLFNSGAI